ncbi:MAG: hypothetical protein JWP29_778 [Rhodoferax sp.]|nr:hypothetical protein [Rhodoferax sp.]
MASAKNIQRLQNLIWVLVYGGLLTLVLGVFTRRTDDGLGWRMVIGGGLVAAVGAVLIYVRSRIKLTQPSGPQT